ncbi:MAG: NAD(P)H-dependent oxidoreductase [Bacteroidota bacterium]
MKIAIISSSVRKGRNSHRVALYFEKFIAEQKMGDVKMLDLHQYQFPIFEERLKNIPDPTMDMKQFSEEVIKADAVLIVTPEYNGGYPAALKNIVDLLTTEWKRKPIAISTVSAGAFGGSQVITSLTFSLWKQGALMVPAMFPVPTVEKSYTETGDATDKEATDKRAKKFLEELIWCAEAKQKMEK